MNRNMVLVIGAAVAALVLLEAKCSLFNKARSVPVVTGPACSGAPSHGW